MDTAPTRSASVRQDQVPFLEYPSAKREDLSRRQCLIYVIPGNPGLIAYYEPFMKTLRELLDEVEAKEERHYAFHIYGRNLLGFEDGDHEPQFGTSAAGVATEPFTLEDQIRCCCEQVQEANVSALGGDRVFDEIVLIGHSVGAYISLEIFNRHHHARREQQSSPWDNVNLKAGILLFPTVSHIAQSSSGQKLDMIRRTPFLDRSAHHIAKGFVNLWSHWMLATVISRFMGFPGHAAAATVRFLTSQDGIWQALHMGKDEMKTIAEEKWSEDMWEIQEAEADEAAGRGTKFFFYFAQKDHWIADECRDEFIEKRRQHEKGRTTIVIDEENIPHAFCIHHSESVAEKVRLWVQDIAGL
ncbi:hypothetical protein C8A03DRAFT_37948 [Achaetomium macrosporum]|uniref:Lipid droplet-associated hydrolase n=1 Tax=Achaetomium macrosporum TaxID=79813 RepID=A0AAN7C3W2_9PEZI|nr:hypothetical protein C8A03DRAFT_37948 [Achaetomium macrosporum]